MTLSRAPQIAQNNRALGQCILLSLSLQRVFKIGTTDLLPFLNTLLAWQLLCGTAVTLFMATAQSLQHTTTLFK